MAVGTEISKTTGGIWSALPLWGKGLILIGGAYAAYSIGKSLIGQTKIDPETRDSSQEEDGWNASLQQDSKQKAPTLSSTQMKSIANSMFRAMDGYGTDEEAIISLARQAKNNADWSGINAAWGKRTISSGAWNPSPDLRNATLGEALHDELSQYWKTKINQVLSSKGIKYRV